MKLSLRRRKGQNRLVRRGRGERPLRAAQRSFRVAQSPQEQAGLALWQSGGQAGDRGGKNSFTGKLMP